ncbi:MAG: hypothetical protein CMF39_03225 [Legionellaceae bacterium]|nr:hypothetical protein [Legionellaceae bacterium]
MKGFVPVKQQHIHPLNDIIDNHALAFTRLEKLCVAAIFSVSSVVSYYATEAFGTYAGQGSDLVPYIGNSKKMNEELAGPAAWSTNFVLSQYMFIVIAMGMVKFAKHRRFAQQHNIEQEPLIKHGLIFTAKLLYSVLPALTLSLLAPIGTASFYLMIATYTFQQAYGLNTFNRLHNLYKHYSSPSNNNVEIDTEASPILSKSDTYERLIYAAEHPEVLQGSTDAYTTLENIKLPNHNNARDNKWLTRAILHPLTMACQTISVYGFFALAGEATMKLSEWWGMGIEERSNLFYATKVFVFFPFYMLNAELTIDVTEQIIQLPEKLKEISNTFKQGETVPILVEISRMLLLSLATLLSFESAATSLELNKNYGIGDWSIWPTTVGVTMFNVFALMEIINNCADTALEHYHYTPETRKELGAIREAGLFCQAQHKTFQQNLPEASALKTMRAPN